MNAQSKTDAPVGVAKKAARLLRDACRAAALLFGAFWLVATSAPLIPARDCFTGIGAQTTLDIQLGEVLERQPSSPTCAELDGLIPGSVLTLDLTERPRAAEAESGCHDYLTQCVQGPTNVSVATGPSSAIRSLDDLTSAYGTFSLPGSADCTGTWFLSLRPETPPPAGELVSPLDAGPARRWIVQRSIVVSQQDSCGAPFTGTGWFQCQEEFLIQSITQRQP